ncbi:MAG: hypothetical protein EKK42_05435 [Pseudonocardiaceae bacterium]|nr:MAG: hypothetical protein EKK42_05435 [Pseudonocardiaceae bacterium]
MAVTPLGYLAATLLGDGLLALQGYPSGAAPAPAVAVAATPALALLLAPPVAAVVFGLRARSLGRASGAVPALLGGSVAIASLAVNLVALVHG